MKTNAIDILLAVHNGSNYLEQQIDSLLTQTFTDWRLIIREEGSTDKSLEIASRYSKIHPNKISVFHYDEPSGACQSFSQALSLTSAPYIMFADQDDVWLPHKIEVTLEKMNDLEKTYGKSDPLMVFTDMKLVDTHLRTVSKSFWRYNNFSPKHAHKLGHELMRNIVYGSTVMLNCPLKKLGTPIPKGVPAHDWWFALIASILGQCGYVDQATILYRRHDENVSSCAQRYSSSFVVKKILRYLKPSHNMISSTQRDLAQILLDRFKPSLDKDTIDKLIAFVTIDQSGFVSKRYRILKYGFLRHGFLRNVGLLCRAGRYAEN